MTRNWKNHPGLKPWLLIIALLITCISSSHAQQITGSITGKVVDEQGALVTNANIKATNVATGYTRINF
jgi:hypothetical protein